MKTSFRSVYGPPDILSIKEVEIPTPKNKELLIKVHAATVNRTDCGVLLAKPFIIRFFTGLFRPGTKSTGTDFAGDVEATGKDVSKFKVGDRVWGFKDSGIGSHAQYTTISEDGNVISIPNGISYERAAASAEGAHYAYSFIKRSRIKAGQKVLVYGATGAIGSAAVQLLKYFGVYVTAVANTRNLDLVRSLGADKVVDYMTSDFTNDEEKYHYVFDAVGKSSFGKCKSLLQKRGVYLSSDLGPGNENIYLPLFTRWRNKRVVFPFPISIKTSLIFLNELLEAKKFNPLIDRRYPLEKIVEAFTYVNSGQKTGNVLLTFDGGYPF